MAMGSEFLKVLHIAPHIGGGIGKAVVGLSLLGKKEGESAHVQVNEAIGYDVKILKIEKTADESGDRIRSF